MKKPTVFISYSHTDSEFVDDLAEKLKVSGVDVWIDKWQIKVGDSITGKINEGIDVSDFLLIVLSFASVKSEWVMKELNSALIRDIEQKKRAFILPVLIEDCEIPPLLRDKRYANFKDGAEKGFSELLEVVSPLKGFEPEMVRIPAGEFLMGVDPEKFYIKVRKDDQPKHSIHSVYLPKYYIGKYPVTNLQYKAFLNTTEQLIPEVVLDRVLRGADEYPVSGISWHDALAYCQWLSNMTGKSYRLPTEAEWEKAARGTDGRIYPWGEHWTYFGKAKCNSRESNLGGPTPVGHYSPQGDSPYGCADMAGNVWEWCSSLYLPYPYRAGDGREDLTLSGERVIRGGSYYNRGSSSGRCDHRDRAKPDDQSPGLGFRIVVSP